MVAQLVESACNAGHPGLIPGWERLRSKWDRLSTPVFTGFPAGSNDKESACHAGDLGLIPGLGKCPMEGHGNPLQYSGLENLHGQRGLAGYSAWGGQESDRTEQLRTVRSNAI